MERVICRGNKLALSGVESTLGGTAHAKSQRAIAEVTLFGAVAFVCYEAVFRSWEKLPFTCSHLPGRTPMWILALRLYAFLWLLPLPNFILLGCLYSPIAFFIVLVALITIGAYLHVTRRDYRSQIRLTYEESMSLPYSRSVS